MTSVNSQRDIGGASPKQPLVRATTAASERHPVQRAIHSGCSTGSDCSFHRKRSEHAEHGYSTARTDRVEYDR